MTIFDQLKDIIETKSGTLLDDYDTFQDFQPFLASRWLSMYGSTNTVILNETTNQLYSGIESKDQWYKLLVTLIPKNKYRFTRYIKKPKKNEKKPDSEVVATLAQTHGLSQREVRRYIEVFNIDIKKIKDNLS